MTRRLAAAIAALALALLFAAPALAGNWAEVEADAAGVTEPPSENGPTVIGFTVLQHGETPASWVTPTVRLTELSTGETMDVRAEQQGPDGHFIATVLGLRVGYWSYTVDFPELESDVAPVVLAVHAADGAAPVFDPAVAMTTIERVRRETRDEILNQLYPEIERIDSALSLQRAINDRTEADLEAITGERDALATRLAEAESGAATSPATVGGILLLAILAGGAAGFVMAWLGGRSGPREATVSSVPEASPRGSTTA